MTFKPLNGYVVLKQDSLPMESPNGFVIRTQEEKAQTGVVLYVSGPYNEGGTLITPEVYVGDRVSFMKYGGTEIEVDGVKLLAVKEYDVIGVVSRTEEK